MSNVSFYFDNGGEFQKLKPFFLKTGISHFVTQPHTPEQSGIVERRHCHIRETGLTLLSQALLPQNFWSYAFWAAVHLINCMLTPILNMLSLYEKLFNKPPSYLHLRTFGCFCFPWLHPYVQHKLDSYSKALHFFGISF